MIKANKGNVTMEGKNLDIMLEFTGIYQTILEDNPEILIAVTLVYANDVEKKLPTANAKLVKMLAVLLKGVKDGAEDDE